MHYWIIIGKTCLDGNFRNRLFQRIDPGQKDPSLLLPLSEFLAAEGFDRLSAFELVDLNRAFQVTKLNQSDGKIPPRGPYVERFPIHRAESLWTKAPLSDEICAWFGACATSWDLAQSYFNAVNPDEIKRLAADSHPRFELDDDESRKIFTFLDEMTPDAFKELVIKLWILPYGVAKGICFGGPITETSPPTLIPSGPALGELGLRLRSEARDTFPLSSETLSKEKINMYFQKLVSAYGLDQPKLL